MNWQSQRYEPPIRRSGDPGPSSSLSGSSGADSLVRPNSHQRSYSDAFSDAPSHDASDVMHDYDITGATPRNARFADHSSTGHSTSEDYTQRDVTWTPEDELRARFEGMQVTPVSAESGIVDRADGDAGRGIEDSFRPPDTAKLSTGTRGEEDDLEDVGDAVHFVLLAEFDIDQGSTLAYQYPYPTGTDEHRLAELMLPDGAHLRAEDWTIFYLGQDHQLAIDPMLAHELTEADASPIRNKRASMYHPSERPKRGAVGGGLLHVLSCVRCKEDKTVKRGALVKSLAICSPVPWIHVFKPILLLALEEYFRNPSPEVLEHLYDCCNSPQILGIPRLTRAEKIIMRLSDRKDLFNDRYEAAIVQMREAMELAASAAEEDGMGMTGGASAAMARRGSSASSQLAVPPNGQGRLTPERKGMRDTHYFDTEVQFRKIRMPMKIPVSVFSEEIGDYSLIELISTFSNNHPPFPAPYHPYLHTNGSATHPIILLINALLAHKRVLVLGTQFPAHSVARAVLGVCALGTGCGQVLRGITETALPYCNLSCYEMLEGMSGFIAGVTNPRFVDLPCWDVLCDIEIGRITVNKNLGGGPGPVGAMDQAGTSEASLGSTVRNDPPEKGKSDQGKGKDGSRPDCIDNTFMDEVTQAIQAHYGEMHIRRRMTDFISRFVRVAAYYEYRYRGTSKAGYPCTPFGEYLGQGTTFVDEAKKQKEMVANQPRIEAWRRTKGYKLHVKDWAKEVSTRQLPFDIHHQIARLRNGQAMSHAEAEAIFDTLAGTVQSHEQVLELLIQCSPHFGGLTPIANGLFHPAPIVREAALDVLIRLQTHSVGQHSVASLNYFHRKAYMHLVEKRRADELLMADDQAAQAGMSPPPVDGDAQSEFLRYSGVGQAGGGMMIGSPESLGSTRRNDIEVRHIGDLVRHIPVEQYDLAAIVVTAPSHARDYAIRHREGDDRPITNVLATVEKILAGKARRKVRNLPEADGVELVEGAPGNDEDPFIPMVMSSGGLIHGDMRQKMKEWKGWGMSGPSWGWMLMSMAIKIAMARGRTFRMGE